ncbi:MAG: choice-of-anchor D domain-containing protein [Verrucomicrobiota bacterium]
MKRKNSFSISKTAAIAVATFALLATLCNTALGQTNFTGDGDGTTWSDAGNWDNGVPNSTTDASIDTSGTFNVNITGNSAAQNLTIGADDTLTINPNLNLDLGPAGSLTNAGVISLGDNSDFGVVNAIANSGQININSTTNQTDFELRGAVNLTSGGTITLSGPNAGINDSSGTQLLTITSQTINGNGNAGRNTINLNNLANGIFDASVSTQTLTLDPAATFGNAGILRATNGGILSILGGSYEQTGGGVIRADGNDGSGNNSTVLFQNGSIVTGGTIESVNGGILRTNISSEVTFNNLTLNGPFTIADNTDLNLANTITNTNEIAFDSAGNPIEIALQTDEVTLTGGGTITMDSSTGGASIRDDGGVKRLILNNQTIQGSGNIGVNSIAVTLDANGEINANGNGGVLLIDPSASVPDGGGAVGVTNNGLMQATSGGTLALAAGDFTNNTVIQADGANSIVQLNTGAVVTGGTLQAINGGTVRTDLSATADLDGVTLNGLFNISDNSDLNLSNTITNNGEIAFDSTGNPVELVLQTNEVILTGGGTVTMDSSAGQSSIRDAFGTRRLTLNNQTIQGTGNIGANEIVITLDANGEINANVNGGILLVDPSSSGPSDGGDGGVTNNGLMQATGGGTLALGAGDFTNNTVIQADGANSVVQLRGSASVTGGTLQSINGGTVTTQDNSTATISDITLNGQFNIGSNSFLQASGTINNTGDISVAPPNANPLRLRTISGVVYTGGGTISMDDTNGPALIDDVVGTQRVTLADQTLQGSGNFGNNTIVITIGENGLVDANLSGQTLTVDPSNVGATDGGDSGLVNNGLMQATSGGTLALAAGDFTNNTLIQADGANSVVQLNLSASVTGGTLQAINGGTVTTQDNSTVTISNLTLAGQFNVGGNSFLQASGTINNTGDISLAPPDANPLRLRSLGGVEFTGGGTISLDNANGFAIIDDISGTQRVTLTDQTVQGAGNFGSNTIVISLGTSGLIDANLAGRTLTVQPTSIGASDGGDSGLVNAGTIRASGGGTANLIGGPYTNTTTGTFEALDNSTVNSNGTLTNLSGGTLTNGTYRSVSTGNTSTLAITGTPVTTIASANTTVELSGANAVITFGGTNLEDTLTNNEGTLKILNGHNFNMTNALNNTGIVELGGNALSAATLTSGGDITNSAGAEIFGHGVINNTILNSGTVRAANGELAIVGGIIDGQSGTIQVDPASTLNLSGASGDSDADFLVHNGTTPNSLNLGANDINVDMDYTNASFGTGNSFDARANVTGSGQINATGDVTQNLTGDVSGGATATATMNFGNVHVGDTSTLTYQVANSGTTGPDLRGALQDNTNGGNITDGRLSGTGVTPSNFGPIATGADSGDLTVTFSAGSAGALTGQVIHVENNFDNVAGQDLQITGAAFRFAEPSAASANPVNFGNFHVGDPNPISTLSLSNTAANDGFSEALNAEFSGTTGDASAAGSFNLLGPGATDNSSLTVGIDVSTAGAKAGTATLDLTSDGASSSGLGQTALPAQTINVSANVFRFAAPDAASPNPVNFGNVHVGDSPLSTLTLSNTAANDGFSEALNAEFSGTTGDASATGSFNLLGPGATDNSSLIVGVDTSTAGAKAGTATLDLTSDGTGSSGLGQTALGSQTVNVSANVFRFAAPDAASPNPVNFGNFHVGDPNPISTLTLSNTATNDGFSEALNAAFSGTTGDASAAGSFNLLGPGATDNSSLTVGVDTSTAGAKAGTATLDLTSDGTGSSGLGQTALGSQTVNVSANVFRFAAPSSASANPVNFGNLRVGDTPSENLSLTNTAANDGFSEALNAAFSGTTGDASATGSFNLLGPGATDNSSLTVGIDTSTGGAKAGTAIIDLTSDGAGSSGLGQTALGSQTVNVSANVFRLASPSAASPNPVDFGIIHVGDTPSQAISFTNTATNDGFSEGLNASIGSLTGDASAAGSFNLLAAGSTDSSSITVGIDTSTAGVKSGSAEIVLASDGTGTSGFGTIALSPQTVNVQATVNNFADPEFSQTGGDGTLSMDSAFVFTLDFGTVAQGSGPLTADLEVLNDVLGPADTLAGSWVLDAADFGTSGFTAFSGIEAGDAFGPLQISFLADTLGSFNGSITLNPRSQNASGFDGALTDVVLNITAEVIPEPSTSLLTLLAALTLLATRRTRKS